MRKLRSVLFPLFFNRITYLVTQLHVGAVLSEDVLDYAPLFLETADAYFEREMYAEARPIYELLGGEASVCGFPFPLSYL